MVVDMLAQTEKTQECRYFNYPNHSYHVESVVLLSKKYAKNFVEIGVDAADYYRIKEK